MEIEVKATRRPALFGLTVSRSVLLMVLVVAAWASATVASKHLYLEHLVTPLALVVCRFTLAGCFSLGLFWLGRQRRRQADSGLPLVGGWRVYLLGGGLITVFITGFNLALLYISATLGGLVFFGLTPLVMLIVGHFWLGGAVGWRQLAGVWVALVGIGLVISGGDWSHLMASLQGDNLLVGLGLMAVGAVGWGVYGLWGKRYGSLQPGGSLLSTGLNQLIGVTPVWVLLFWLEPNGLAGLQPQAWLYILYIGIVPSSLGFALFYSLLKDLSLSQAATIQLLSPIFTEALAVVFLGEPFGLALLVGTVVLLVGVRLSLSVARSTKKVEEV